MRAAGSVSRHWAKDHAAARSNLANSGLRPRTPAGLAWGCYAPRRLDAL